MRPRTVPQFEFAGHRVLIAPGAGRLVVLDPLGDWVWNTISEGADQDTLIRAMVHTFGIDTSRAADDLRNLFAHWREAGLLGTEIPATTVVPASTANITAQPATSNHPDKCAPDAGTATYRLFESPFTLCFATMEIQASVAPLLRHLEVDRAAEGMIFRLTGTPQTGFGLAGAGGSQIFDSLDALVFALFDELVLLGQNAREWLAVVHAGAVVTDERCILLPGTGGSGKSTLTAALIAAGCQFLGDDGIPIDWSTGQAIPLPLPLNLKQGSLPALTSRFPEISAGSSFGRGGRQLHYFSPPAQAVARSTYSVQALVFPRYRRDASFSWSELNPLEALTRLIIADTVLGRPLSSERVGRFLGWLEQIPAYEMEYADLNTACTKLFELADT